MVFVRFDLSKGLKGVKVFLVVTKLSLMKRLLDRLLNLVHFEFGSQYGICSVVAGGLKGFSRICSVVGVEPK